MPKTSEGGAIEPPKHPLVWSPAMCKIYTHWNMKHGWNGRTLLALLLWLFRTPRLTRERLHCPKKWTLSTWKTVPTVGEVYRTVPQRDRCWGGVHAEERVSGSTRETDRILERSYIDTQPSIIWSSAHGLLALHTTPHDRTAAQTDPPDTHHPWPF